jgi:hypothetical protein
MNGKRKKAEYDRQYRALNRGEKIAADKAYREKNREQIHEMKHKRNDA